MSRFDYVQYDEQAKAYQTDIKVKVENCEGALTYFPDSDNKKNAIKALEEFYMWCGKCIRDQQLNDRNGPKE